MNMPPPSGGQYPQPPVSPHNQGHPNRQFGYNAQQPPPGWQQGNWPQQPGPPIRKGNSLKWLLIGVAALLVIGITVGATLTFTQDSGHGGPTTPTSGALSELASAADSEPARIITSEPTCQTFVGISNSLADVETQGWGEIRGSLGPKSEWTADQRTHVEAVTRAMRGAADQSEPLLKQTPHRVIRELYGQFIAFGRAYADSVADYLPADDGLASANVNAGSAIVGICNSINLGSASRAMAVDPAAGPTALADTSNALNPERFITSTSSTCTEWVSRLNNFNTQTTEWGEVDPSVPASQWTPERRALEASVRPLILAFATDIEGAGRQSGNPTLEDFAVSAALYLRAYLAVGDSYSPADGWLSYVGFKFANLVSGACRAAAR